MRKLLTCEAGQSLARWLASWKLHHARSREALAVQSARLEPPLADFYDLRSRIDEAISQR